jgi:hypothetical protein
MDTVRSLTLTGLILAAVALLGCIKEKPQSYWESQAATTLIHYMNIYDGLNPQVPKTNVAQIITNIDDRPYPVELHREFLRYGRYAGFTNSLFEKYVFVPEAVTNLVKQGRPILMNSEPFPDTDKRLQRYIIYEVPSQTEPTYSRALVSETVVQIAFKAVGMAIPEPPRFPPAPPIPPPPAAQFDRKVHDYFRSLAVQLGMSSYHGRVLERIAAGIGALSLVIMFSLGLRYARRRVPRQ